MTAETKKSKRLIFCTLLIGIVLLIFLALRIAAVSNSLPFADFEAALKHCVRESGLNVSEHTTRRASKGSLPLAVRLRCELGTTFSKGPSFGGGPVVHIYVVEFRKERLTVNVGEVGGSVYAIEFHRIGDNKFEREIANCLERQQPQIKNLGIKILKSDR
jgi:hypothetical protein